MLSNLKTWLSGAWRSRTLWIAVGLVVLGELDAELHILQSVLPGKVYARAVAICGLAMFALRVVTDRSIVAKARAAIGGVSAPPAKP
jgi:hypothetical protein